MAATVDNDDFFAYKHRYVTKKTHAGKKNSVFFLPVVRDASLVIQVISLFDSSTPGLYIGVHNDQAIYIVIFI